MRRTPPAGAEPGTFSNVSVAFIICAPAGAAIASVRNAARRVTVRPADVAAAPAV
jgi:hypothetical protein